LEESRETDILVERLVYRHAVEQDADGEWRAVTAAAQDVNNVASFPAVPHYSSDAALAERAFRDALAVAGQSRDDYEIVRPEDLYGDAWGIRPMTQAEPLVTAPGKAVLFCRGAIAVLRAGAVEDWSDLPTA
jgi:hypothetical protein